MPCSHQFTSFHSILLFHLLCFTARVSGKEGKEFLAGKALMLADAVLYELSCKEATFSSYLLQDMYALGNSMWNDIWITNERARSIEMGYLMIRVVNLLCPELASSIRDWIQAPEYALPSSITDPSSFFLSALSCSVAPSLVFLRSQRRIYLLAVRRQQRRFSSCPMVYAEILERGMQCRDKFV